MSASSSSWESYLTPQERNAYAQYFRAANRSQSGSVTGPEAVQFFATSGVPTQILSEVEISAHRTNSIIVNCDDRYGKPPIATMSAT